MIKNLFTSFRRQLVLAACSTVAVTLVACSGGSDSTSATQPIYTAIFDAGSSGTRLSLYKVIPGNGGYPTITLIDTNKFKDNGINDFILGTGSIATAQWATINSGYNAPGCNINIAPVVGGSVANGSGNTASVGPCVLQPLLDSMSTYLTQYGLSPSQVKVELFATAGMRTVEYKNGGTKSDEEITAFYQAMKDYVSNVKGYSIGDFRTSNGNSEEGVWTWVNLNDQYYNVFGGNPTYSPSIQTPVGDFEVGGSSMQIAFPTNQTASDANNVYFVRINGKSFNVYSKTFLGLGGDDTRKFMRSAGYTTGGTYAYDGGRACFASSATTSNTAESSGIALFYNQTLFPGVTAPIGNPATNAPQSTWLTEILNTQPQMTWASGTVGSWSSSTCASRYSAITDAVISLPRNAIGTTNSGANASYASLRQTIASSSVPFVGTDTFYFVAKDLGMATATGFNSNAFASALNSTCSGSISGDDLFSQGLCANGSYMNDFLFRSSNGLFTNNGSATFAGVVSGDDPQGNTVLTWTRGYLLLKYAN